MPKASLVAVAALGVVALLSGAPVADAQPGGAASPVVLKMKRGSDVVVVHGVLRQNADCCAYVFEAAAGQKLYWTETGAAARMGIVQPDGEIINPGLPNPADLPQSGPYRLMIAPDIMADGAFGPFTLTLRIPPAR